MNNSSNQQKRKNVSFSFKKEILIKIGNSIVLSKTYCVINEELVELHENEEKIRVINHSGFVTEFEKKHISNITESGKIIWDIKTQRIKE